MTDNLNLSLWVARRAEQGTLQAHAAYVVEEIKFLEQAVKYEADLAQMALGSRKELEAEVKKYHDAWLEAEAQVVELEAKLAKAIRSLTFIGCEENAEGRHARTTLAELRGEQDG